MPGRAGNDPWVVRRGHHGGAQHRGACGCNGGRDLSCGTLDLHGAKFRFQRWRHVVRVGACTRQVCAPFAAFQRARVQHRVHA